MKKFIALTVLFVLSSVGSSQAFDKDKFKLHFRKAFNLDAKLGVEVGDPSPSQFAGLSSFTVTIAGQSQLVYLTKDERYYFWGSVFDLTTDPDKERWSKLNLENVHVKGPSSAL